MKRTADEFLALLNDPNCVGSAWAAAVEGWSQQRAENAAAKIASEREAEAEKEREAERLARHIRAVTPAPDIAPRSRAEKAQARHDVSTHTKAILKALAAGPKRKADVRAVLEGDFGHGFGIQNFNDAWKETPESLKIKRGAPPK